MDPLMLASVLIGATMLAVSVGLWRLRPRPPALEPPPEPPDEGAEAFTADLEARIRDRLGARPVQITRTDPLKLSITSPQTDVPPILAPLGRLRAEVEADPDRAEPRIEAFVDGLMGMIDAAAPQEMAWDRARMTIMPQLVPTADDAPTGDTRFSFGHDLEVRLVLAGIGQPMEVRSQHLDRWAITAEDARRIAVDNLARASEQAALIEHITEGAGDLYVYETRDGHDATRILLVERWRELASRCTDRLFIAIPSQDFLVAFTDANDDHVEHIRKQVFEDWMKEGERRLTWKFFEVTDQGITPCDVPLH